MAVGTVRECAMLIDGAWMQAAERLVVTDKYRGTPFATVPASSRVDVDRAVAAAVRAFAETRRMPAHRRSEIVRRAAEGIAARREEFARTIAVEAGKALKYARIEVDRAISTFTFAAEEAKRIHGETVPLDATPAGEGAVGYYVRVPVGPVAAISPFNFPLNLVAHKVAPALAAANTVVLKPATYTPVTAVLLGEVLLDAGVLPGAFNLVFGGGSTVGDWLVTDPRVACVTFTGSVPVGRAIIQRAGIRRVILELGNSSPAIVCADADLATAVSKLVVGAFYNSGQVCLSTQRIYVERPVYETFLDAFAQATRRLVVGDPTEESTDVGPMIDLGDAERVESWIEEAIGAGATVVAGGRRTGAVVEPTVLVGAPPTCRVVRSEVFGPVVTILPFDAFEEALDAANATEYGLQAALFTHDSRRIFDAVDALEFGGVIVNDAASFRADHMPYGGIKQSGLGREGVRFAMEEMTEIRMVVIRR